VTDPSGLVVVVVVVVVACVEGTGVVVLMETARWINHRIRRAHLRGRFPPWTTSDGDTGSVVILSRRWSRRSLSHWAVLDSIELGGGSRQQTANIGLILTPGSKFVGWRNKPDLLLGLEVGVPSFLWDQCLRHVGP